MADIQHKNIVDPDIHEPKGVNAAAINSVYLANGAGSGAWTAVNYPVVADPIVQGRSTVAQNPSAVDTPLQLTFGAAQTTSDVDIASDGTVTIKTAGTYNIIFVLRAGRSTNTGTATIGFRWLVNGVMMGKPTATTIETAAHTVPFAFSTANQFAANDVITAEVVRDSSGVNDGGMIPFDFALADWEIAASAVIIIFKTKAAL